MSEVEEKIRRRCFHETRRHAARKRFQQEKYARADSRGDIPERHGVELMRKFDA